MTMDELRTLIDGASGDKGLLLLMFAYLLAKHWGPAIWRSFAKRETEHQEISKRLEAIEKKLDCLGAKDGKGESA